MRRVVGSAPASARRSAAKEAPVARSPRPPGRATLRDVFAIAAFRPLLLADVLPAGGDQVSRVALSVTVFDRTRSPLLAALAYAASIVPMCAGGIILGRLADRFPRRRVMITCDLGRAALVLAMTVPGLPLAAVAGMLAVVAFFDTPF